MCGELAFAFSDTRRIMCPIVGPIHSINSQLNITTKFAEYLALAAYLWIVRVLPGVRTA
jgi:hypothetical protein